MTEYKSLNEWNGPGMSADITHKNTWTGRMKSQALDPKSSWTNNVCIFCWFSHFRWGESCTALTHRHYKREKEKKMHIYFCSSQAHHKYGTPSRNLSQYSHMCKPSWSYCLCRSSGTRLKTGWRASVSVAKIWTARQGWRENVYSAIMARPALHCILERTWKKH